MTEQKNKKLFYDPIIQKPTFIREKSSGYKSTKKSTL